MPLQLHKKNILITVGQSSMTHSRPEDTVFAAFVAPARPKSELWRLIVGLLLVTAAYAGGFALLAGTVWLFAGPAAADGLLTRLAAADTPTAVVLLLFTFVGMAAGPVLAARWLHGRSPSTLLGPDCARGFAAGAVAAAAVFLVQALVLPAPYDPVPNTPLALFLTFLPAALIGLAIQTGAEEVLFRGYLQSQLAARFDHWAAWMLLPSLLFGALHWNPAAGENAPLLVAAATLFGLLAADLTRVTGSIGAAWGLHFANNCMAILVVGLDGTLSGLALWRTPFDAAAVETLRPLLLQDMAMTLAIWAALRLWFARPWTRPAGLIF
jgi:membrane protease YdiL (CAAX protease family)